METRQHQEWRSRQHIDPVAVLKAGLTAGLVFFILSGGAPWSTAGTMNAIMGRDVSLGIVPLLALHLILSIFYTFIIASVIYRFRTPVATGLGVGVGMALYGINFLVFQALGVAMKSPEFRAFLVHFLFALVASLSYKALSVPKPLKT